MSRALKEGAFGPGAFTLLLPLLTHFDRDDTGGGYTRRQILDCALGRLFATSGEFRVLVLVETGSERTLAPRRDVGGGSDGGERTVSHFDAYVVAWVYGHVPEAVRFV